MSGFSLGVHVGRWLLVPRPDEVDEPPDEFRWFVFGDVGERLIRLLIELERSEIVSKSSGMGRKICASGLNGRMGRSASELQQTDSGG